MSSRHRILMIPLILIFVIVLAGCAPKFPSKGEIEKTVEGHTWKLAWGTATSEAMNPGGCTIILLEESTTSVHAEFLNDPCTGELIISKLEEFKGSRSADSPAWTAEMFDQFISEVRQIQ